MLEVNFDTFLCCLFSVTSLAPRLPSDEERLLELLFDGYNPSARPVINSSHTVDVAMQFSLLQIQELVCNVFITIGNLLCMEKIIRRTVWLERMKVNLVIFSVRFIFQLIDETDTTTFSIYA